MSRSVVSAPYYEMEIWSCKSGDENKVDVVGEGESEQFLSLIKHTDEAAFLTLERAIGDIDEVIDAFYESDYTLCFTIIRRKALYVRMPVNYYLKEWLFFYDKLQDESVWQNCTPENYIYSRRPKEKIRFSVGNIVSFIDDGICKYGIIAGTPVSKEDNLSASEYNFTHNQYKIILSADGFEKQIPAQRVFEECYNPYILDVIKEPLQRGLKSRTKNK